MRRKSKSAKNRHFEVMIMDLHGKYETFTIRMTDAMEDFVNRRSCGTCQLYVATRVMRSKVSR